MSSEYLLNYLRTAAGQSFALYEAARGFYSEKISRYRIDNQAGELIAGNHEAFRLLILPNSFYQADGLAPSHLIYFVPERVFQQIAKAGREQQIEADFTRTNLE